MCIGRRIAGRISLAVFFHRLQHFTHRLPTTPNSSQFCNTTFHRPSSLAPSICTFEPAPYLKGPVLLFASSGGNKILLLLLNALPLRVSVFHGVFLEHQMCRARERITIENVPQCTGRNNFSGKQLQNANVCSPCQCHSPIQI